MFVGTTGIDRVVERTAQLMVEHDTDDVARARRHPARRHPEVPELPLLASRWTCSARETSTNVANYFTAGLKGRWTEERRTDDHLLTDDVDHGRRDRATARSARPRCRRSSGSTPTCAASTSPTARTASTGGTGSSRSAGLPQRLRLPHVAFNRQGRRVRRHRGHARRASGSSAEEWARRRGQWLPTDVDKTHVRSLMRPVYERGKIAAWIAPPRQRHQRQAVRLRLRAPRLTGRAAMRPSCSTPATYLLDRRLAAGDGDRLALTGAARRPHVRRSCTTESAAPRPGCADLGLRPEQRLLMVMADSPEFVDAAPGRDAHRRDPGAGLDDAAGGRPRRAAARLPGAAVRVLARSTPRPRSWRPRSRPELRTLLATGPTSASSKLPVHRLDRCWRRRCRRTGSTRPPRTRPRSGSTPPAPPARRRRAMHRHGSVRVVCETYGAAGARHPPRRPLPVRGQGVLRVRAGQLACCSRSRSGRRRCSNRRRRDRTRSPTAPASTARRCSSPARRSSPTCCGPTCPPTRWPAVRLAASAGEPLPAALYQRWTGALRRRHHRRHRHDRDAAHLPVQPARRGAARHDRASRCPATTCASSTSGGRRAGRLAGHAAGARRLGRHRVLVPLRRLPAGVPGRMAAHRRHLRARRRRLLRLPRPHRRHAEGRAASGCRRPRSRPGCWPTTRSRRRSWSPRPTPTDWRSRSRSWCWARTPPRPRRSCSRSAGTGWPSFKRPRRVVFVDAYPTTATGKIRRVELRETATTILRDPVVVST